ncbi:uncharacterized protein LOC129772922 [Toxorhynchites rutilus septentrionalis]|uniref:uncharacterized protein LOC129772922 n=2 Tax=Toxorhynchites rutilus septentrionalis TaxID=329112 RepID=UPI0024789A2C|nr:uncharacterized protein LOC129772922 [Toxorhynchites rutilus septentrionalis]
MNDSNEPSIISTGSQQMNQKRKKRKVQNSDNDDVFQDKISFADIVKSSNIAEKSNATGNINKQGNHKAPPVIVIKPKESKSTPNSDLSQTIMDVENENIIETFVTQGSESLEIDELRSLLCEWEMMNLLDYFIVTSSIGHKEGKIFLWTDSTVALYWIAGTPSTWKTFVANRVAEIQRLAINAIWRHVPSLENPADLISRGVNASSLVNNLLWWNGPDWLASTDQPWPDNITLSSCHTLSEECVEIRKTALHITTTSCDIFERYSSYTKLLRVASLCRRFAKNSTPGCTPRFGPISSTEVHQKLLALVRIVQQEHFAVEIDRLAKAKQIPRSSRLRFLNPELRDGLIRVGGRLKYAAVPENHKNPLVLPENHQLTLLIVNAVHRRTLHSGPQLLLAVMRHEFWPLSGRNLARKVVHNCVICTKAKPRNMEQLMGQLPSERINRAYPFQHVGVDFAGPVYIKPSNRKGAPVKAYVAVFVCLTVKATHLELVTDLTSAAFIAALRRFIARRGLPSAIYCDNATNFTAAQRELKELRQLLLSQHHKNAIHLEAASLKIEFHFIPPRAPTFGGLWEACVKSFKHHMRRIVGNSLLSVEAFTTVLAQIEACLNSRPITPLSPDPRDLQALTPGHFLIGRPLLAVPEPDLAEIPENRLDLWQKIQSMVQHFWKRWQNEYLSTLQLRYKWTTSNQNLLVGAIVLIREENLPVGKWSMGRVVEIHPGEDGLVRVATVKLPNNQKPMKRPITKLCLLPIQVDAAVIEGSSSPSRCDGEN